MPLTKKGQEIEGKMEGKYGAKKGKQVFYATANKRPSFRRAVRGTSSRGV